MDIPKRVAIIGAGSSGLASIRHLATESEWFTVVAFEKQSHIGGLWNYSDKTEDDDRGHLCTSSIYKSLRTNSAKQTTGYTDLEFPDDLPSFPEHTDVKKYLDRYAEKFSLHKYIKFETLVTAVHPSSSASDTAWLVTTRDLTTDTILTSEYDLVIVSNGKAAFGYVPDIPGKETFRGVQLHSKYYRKPDMFKDKVVLVLGASYSGTDIMIDLAPVVCKLYLAHRKERLKFEFPDNVEQTPSISQILPNGVMLENGEYREVDAIIFATGYTYDLPFLSAECGITVTDNRIQPLYRHVFNINFPTMCFVGILTEVVEFQISALQAQYVASVVKGEAQLPSKSEMFREEEEDYQKRIVAKKLRPRKMHSLPCEQFPYWKKISAETNIPLYEPYVEKLFTYIASVVAPNTPHYKSRNFRIIGTDDFEEITGQL